MSFLAWNFSVYIYIYLFIYLYIFVCVCVCVCVGGWVGVCVSVCISKTTVRFGVLKFIAAGFLWSTKIYLLSTKSTSSDTHKQEKVQV